MRHEWRSIVLVHFFVVVESATIGDGGKPSVVGEVGLPMNDYKCEVTSSLCPFHFRRQPPSFFSASVLCSTILSALGRIQIYSSIK